MAQESTSSPVQTAPLPAPTSAKVPQAQRPEQQKPDASLNASSGAVAKPSVGNSAQPADPHVVLPVLSARQRRRADDAFVEGAGLLERNQPDRAMVAFERALKIDPSSAAAVQALAVAREHEATALVQQAAGRKIAGDTLASDRLLDRAAQLSPGNAIVQQHFPGLQPDGTQKASAEAAAPEITRSPAAPTLASLFPSLTDAGSGAAGVDPNHELLAPGLLKQIDSLAAPVHLHPAAVRRDFDLRGDAQTVVRQVGQAYGLRVQFEGEIPATQMRLHVDQASYNEAMPTVLRMAHLFAVPLDSTSVLVADDTLTNRERYERQVEQTLFLPGLSVEQMNDIGNMVRNIFEIKQTSVQPLLGNVVVRGPEDTVHALKLTLADLIDGEAQVLLDVKLYLVDSSRMRNLGFTPPGQIGAYNVVSEAQQLVTANQTLVDTAIANGLPTGNTPTETLLIEAAFLIASGVTTNSMISNSLFAFGGGKTLTGVYVGNFPAINLLLNESETRTLDDLSLRLDDRQEGSVRSGSRYPIITGSFSTGSSALTSALANTTVNGVNLSSLLGAAANIPQFTYEDLGLTLKATPVIQRSNAVSVHLDLKIEALTGASLSSIPILANQAMVTNVTVPDGQTAVLVSSLSSQESAAVSGIPGLSELTGFQGTTDKDVQRDTSELVIVLTPHITRRRHELLDTPRIAMHGVSTDD
jgi:general secretion pathway protein D